MFQLKMSIMRTTALILVVNYYLFGANAFDHVALPYNFHDGKHVQKSHEQISSNKENNHIPIYPNGRHKRFDTVQNIEQYINDERKSVTKRHIRGYYNTATESLLAINQNVKGDFQNRKSKSRIESYPLSRGYIPTNRPNREYLPSSRKYLSPSREYLPPSREYLPPNRWYLPVLKDPVTEITTMSNTGTVEMTSTTQELKKSTKTETILKVEERGNSTQQTPTDHYTSTVPDIKLMSEEQTKTLVRIDTGANATVESHNNTASTVPDIKLISEDQTKTLVSIDRGASATVQSLNNNASTEPDIKQMSEEQIKTLVSIDRGASATVQSLNNNASTEPDIKQMSEEQIKTIVSIDTGANATVENHKNDASTVPKIETNTTAEQQTVVVDVTGLSNSSITSNSVAMNPDLQSNNCSNTTESVVHHKEDQHKKYDHIVHHDTVVHHYHHIIYHHHHYYDPHIYHYDYDVPHIQDYHHEHNYHNCDKHNSTSTTMKPCSDNTKHKHVQKHKFHGYPSFSNYPHYSSYPHFPAYPYYSPISYESDESSE